MRNFPLIILLLGCALLLSSCKKDPSVPEDDFWEIADPVAAGLHPDSLEKARTSAMNLNNFYALIVVKNGKLIEEAYFRGKRESDLLHVRSITKNFTSALTGIALREGQLGSLDEQASAWFPDELQGNKEQITVRHLLNMASGFSWDEDAEIIDLIEHRVPNPLDYLLERELSDMPGSRFNYNSLSPQVVAAIIEEESGIPFEQYAAERLFEPLGIRRYGWTRDPMGQVWAGFGLQLRARDLARFGLLYLQGGAWEGQELVPSSWVARSGQAQLETGVPGSGYSLQWWISENLDHTLYYGLGFGGQGLLILPDLDMAVIALQESRVDHATHVEQWNAFVREVFLPIYRGVEH